METPLQLSVAASDEAAKRTWLAWLGDRLLGEDGAIRCVTCRLIAAGSYIAVVVLLPWWLGSLEPVGMFIIGVMEDARDAHLWVWRSVGQEVAWAATVLALIVAALIYDRIMRALQPRVARLQDFLRVLITNAVPVVFVIAATVAAAILAALIFRVNPVVTLIISILGSLGVVIAWLGSGPDSTVDAEFPRASKARAAGIAESRRRAIRNFLNNHVVPPLHDKPSFAVTPVKIKEHVVRRQEVDDDPVPKRTAEFLEFPPNLPRAVEARCIEGKSEIAGQYVRLKFELQKSDAGGWGRKIWRTFRTLPPEDVIVPLLQRVVDAAIIADRYFDDLREEKKWKAMPFFERIYAEWRPMPWVLACLLRPVTGDGMPARVVIETRYPDVFRDALFGTSAPSRKLYANWFGIGISVVKPELPYQRRLWWASAQTFCRRLKAHASGGISERIVLRTAGEEPSDDDPTIRLMSSGPLADGCPSVRFPQLVRRGSVSNAPAAFVFNAENRRKRHIDQHLSADCRGVCMRGLPNASEAEMMIDSGRIGQVLKASGDLPKFYWGPRLYWLVPSIIRRKRWIGAFVDETLRQANRFPHYGCMMLFANSLNDLSLSILSDMRGAFVRPVRARKRLGGVMVATGGPTLASNLMLPESLLNDYLNHFVQVDRVIARMPKCSEPFVPEPDQSKAR